MKRKNNIFPFKTPQDYFANFEDRLFAKIEEDQFPKSSGFKVPEAYFDNMEHRMLAISTADDRIKTISFYPKKYFGYAAAFAACLILGIFAVNQKADNLTVENIHISMVDKYIEDGNLNLDLYDLTSYLEDGDISGIKFEALKLSEVALENYLLDIMQGDIMMEDELNLFE